MSVEPDAALAGWYGRLHAAVAEELPAAIALRQVLHADPRRSGDEADTTAAVVSALGVGPGRAVAGTGRLLRIGTATGPTVALRAELDGLVVREATGIPWAATSGIMHACGHDTHLAGLVAVCRAVARAGGPAPLLALLQPREESAPSGARDVARSGLLEQEQVVSVIAAHVQPQLLPGVVNATPGPVNAATDEFTITVTGRGGHGGYPHTTADPVLALAAVVVNIQQLVSRRVDPTVGAVLSMTQLDAGSTWNVVPDTAVARGGLRVLRESDRTMLLAALEGAAEHIAAAYGCTAQVHTESIEPVLVNDPALARAAVPWLQRPGAQVDDGWRSFGADDFSHYCRDARGLMLFVGVEGGEPDAAGRRPGLHSARFLPGADSVARVADALLAAYLAAAGQLGPVPPPA